ncbi:MAG: hypothetical protein CUN53_01360, partial [Phototrophicales bacterium]
MVLVSISGIVAVTQLQQELIPSVEFPQTIILAQASGMTGEQVLTVLTEPIEAALSSIPEIVNVESQTTAAFGTVITARNDFGQNQERLRARIQAAIDALPLPLRRIAPPVGEDGAAFATRLLGDLTPETLIYLAERDSNFIFQLAPETWAQFSDETVREVMAYLASQRRATDGQDTALRQLVEQEIVPVLESIPVVARVQVGGGQVLPEEGGAASTTAASESSARSLLLQLSTPVWNVVSGKIGIAGGLNENAVEALSSQPFTIPSGIPPLPESWQIDRFKDARDLLEMRTLTRNLGAMLNNFRGTGV